MKTKIITMTILSSLLTASTFAAEINLVNNDLSVIKEKKEVAKQITSQVSSENDEEASAFVVEDKELTLIELLSQAKTEKERQIILMEKRTEKTLFSEKTGKIFTNFDFILDKLDKVKVDVDREVDILRNKEIDVKFLDEKDVTFKEHFNKAKINEVSAWLKIQDINFEGKKEDILGDLEGVKELLAGSKMEIKLAFADLKEMLSFVKGAAVILK